MKDGVFTEVNNPNTPGLFGNPPTPPAPGKVLIENQLERSPSELNRGRDSRIGFDLLEDSGRGKEAAGMALSDDLRERVVGAVVEGGMSRLFRRLRRGETVVPVE